MRLGNKNAQTPYFMAYIGSDELLVKRWRQGIIPWPPPFLRRMADNKLEISIKKSLLINLASSFFIYLFIFLSHNSY